MDGRPPLTIGYQLKGESYMQIQVCWSPSYELSGLQYEELTISMAECKELAFVTLAKIEK